MPHPELTIRPLADAGELPLFQRLDYVLDDEIADDLAAGRRRPEWMWVVTRGERLLARAAWWSGGGDVPESFDFFDVDDTLPPAEGVALGVALVRAALRRLVPPGATPPEYGRFIPVDWREDPGAGQVVRTRTTALEQLGARLVVERLRLEWLPGTPLAEPRNRLTFRPVGDRDELIELMIPVLKDTLDFHSRNDLAELTPREVAVKHYDEEFAGFTSPREWWQVAENGDGDPVGFVVPARNSYNPIIAYLGVLPAHRGHGYVDDILAEGTRILAEQNVPRIRAATDVPNVPMANAFARNGYVNFARAINYAFE